MPSILTSLFSSRDSYLSKHIASINAENAFPIGNLLSFDEFYLGLKDNSLLISGGTTEERSILLIELIRKIPGKIVILHNGNKFLRAESFKKCGLHAEEWDGNIYKGMTKAQIISLLSGEKRDDELLSFYAFGFDVCEVVGSPVSIEGIRSIDWLDTKWQQDLLNAPQRDRAFDLLARFDRQMAEKAIKGMCRIERLSRSVEANRGIGMIDVLDKDTLLTKEVYGSNSLVTRQCIEAVQAMAESGVKFTLVLDDVYFPDYSLIKDNLKNVRIVLSMDDITQLDANMHITNRMCNIVIFKHACFGSAKVLSETFFGEYDKLVAERSDGYSKTYFSPSTCTRTTTIRNGKELRLKPQDIVYLHEGEAFVHLVNGQEGMVSIW